MHANGPGGGGGWWRGAPVPATSHPKEVTPFLFACSRLPARGPRPDVPSPVAPALSCLQDEVLIAGFGRSGHAKGDIPGVRFKVRRVFIFLL